MQDIPQFYIRGKPIDTKIGKCYFIKVEEFEELMKYQVLLYLTKEEIYSTINDILIFDKQKIYPFIKPNFIEQMSKIPYIEIIKNLPQLGLYDLYKSIYNFFLKKDVFDTFTKDEDLLVYKIKIMGELENNFLDDEEDEDINKQIDSIKSVKPIQLVNIIRDIQTLPYYKLYNELFNLCFKDEEGAFNKITNDEEFNYYKKLIIDMNLINYEKINPNPEIERFNQYDRILRESKGEKITWESIYTSLWLELKKQPEDLTIYQFYRMFGRLSQFKAFDASLMGAPYGGNLESWCKDLNDNEKEKVKEELEDISDEMIEKMEKVVADI